MAPENYEKLLKLIKQDTSNFSTEKVHSESFIRVENSILSELEIELIDSAILLVQDSDDIYFRTTEGGAIQAAPRWVEQSLLDYVERNVGTDTTTTHKIIPAPGFGLLRIAKFVFSKKAREQVFVPIICDMQVEHINALEEGNLLKARWVVIRGQFSFWNKVVCFAPVSLLRQCTDIWKSIGPSG